MLRPTKFTNVWLKCAKMIALAVGRKQCNFRSHFVDDWFLRNGDRRIAKDCRLDTYYYAKTTSKVCKYSERHKTTILVNSFHRMVKSALCIVFEFVQLQLYKGLNVMENFKAISNVCHCTH